MADVPPPRIDLDAIRAGSSAAWTHLVGHALDEVRAFIASRIPAGIDMDDVVHDTFVIAYRKIDSLQDSKRILSWLKGIARLRMLELLRERHRRPRLAGDQLDRLIEEQQEQFLEADIDAARSAHEFHALRDCLSALSPRLRTILHRRYCDGTPLKTLARQFKQRTDALTSKLQRVRASLRDCLADKGVLR